IWAGEGIGNFRGTVITIPLDASGNVSGPYVPAFPVPEAVATGSARCFPETGGIAIDRASVPPTLYVSYDCSTIIHKYAAATGAYIGGIPWAGNSCWNSGVAIGGNLLHEGAAVCNHVWVVDKTSLLAVSDFSTGGDPVFDYQEGLTCDTKTFFPTLGKHVVWSKLALPNLASAFEIPLNSCGTGGR